MLLFEEIRMIPNRAEVDALHFQEQLVWAAHRRVGKEQPRIESRIIKIGRSAVGLHFPGLLNHYDVIKSVKKYDATSKKGRVDNTFLKNKKLISFEIDDSFSKFVGTITNPLDKKNPKTINSSHYVFNKADQKEDWHLDPISSTGEPYFNLWLGIEGSAKATFAMIKTVDQARFFGGAIRPPKALVKEMIPRLSRTTIDLTAADGLFFPACTNLDVMSNPINLGIAHDFVSTSKNRVSSVRSVSVVPYDCSQIIMPENMRRI